MGGMPLAFSRRRTFLYCLIKLNLLFSIFRCRIHQLEKDLFYYKKTSRDLKKKLRELLASNPTPTPHSDDGTNHGNDCFVYLQNILLSLNRSISS